MTNDRKCEEMRQRRGIIFSKVTPEGLWLTAYGKKIKPVIINRHNYEEFFLLYADNELTEADRRAVENFVQHNADLARELNMLAEVKLEDENISFGEKEILYKKESGISLSNYKEYFFLSVDDELTAGVREEVEKFILMHPKLQEEFTLLSQAKLQPEVIKFEGKEQLYRTEKERRLIPLVWMRVGIAAALSCLVAAAWLLVDNRVNNSSVEVMPPKNAVRKNDGQIAVAPTPFKANAGVVVKQATEKKQDIEKPAKLNSRKDENIAQNKNPQSIKTEEPKQSNQSKAPVAENNVAVTSNTGKEQKSLPLAETANENKVNDVAIENTAKKTLPNNPGIVEPPMAVTHAAYREVDNNEEENSFYIGSAQINKNKLKGLFKKAATLFDKKAGRRDNEKTTQIASFEIKS